MSLSSPANIAGTFNHTGYNNGNSSGSIRYESTHVDGSSPASGRYYYQVFIGTSSSSNDENNWVYFNTTDNKWYDHGTHDPATFTVQGGSASNPSSTVSSNDTIVLRDGNGAVFTFTHPSWLLGSTGPTVSSITVANEIASTRQFTVAHTGTLTASDISYKINGVDITSLSSPNTPITNLQTPSTGSTFDSYTLNSIGYHIINIGTKYLEFYKSLTTIAQTSFPELNNAGLSISFPSTSALWLAKAPGFDSVTLYNDGTQYKGTSQFNGYDRVEYLWVGTKYFSNTDPSLRGFKRYTHTYIHETKSWIQGTVFYIDPVARYENTGLLTSTFTSASLNHYNSYSFDFVSLLAQAPTNTSNGGGKPDRYPLIMTNLFNRNRSLYSIGMTHKDTWDLFL